MRRELLARGQHLGNAGAVEPRLGEQRGPIVQPGRIHGATERRGVELRDEARGIGGAEAGRGLVAGQEGGEDAARCQMTLDDGASQPRKPSSSGARPSATV